MDAHLMQTKFSTDEEVVFFFYYSNHLSKLRITQRNDKSISQDKKQEEICQYKLSSEPTFTIHSKNDFQVATAPNASPDFLEKFPTNCSMIDTVNNLFLEKYPSYSGHKTSVIHQ
ncbi:unnamed protein product [Rhizophagus irregularis]|uniref:Uncharacterized protein n=1 Tax=Rhizophagus irregularis TaxID=588596 RepID=A0A2N1N676_9GLOM|nr:hypothetical protein RhiirC2_712732 [Rhizophagus irregularis]CAB4383862.1 unnamed protein product [Rhizophagus irregularis]CAB5353792.1 unnamed protein product [Rhizophagus irregularis]